MPIAPDLLRAYNETWYHVESLVPIILRPGHYSAALAQLHERLGVEASAVITAWNPYSVMSTQKENDARHEQLQQLLNQKQLDSLSAHGKHPSGAWPAERSLFITGIDFREACAVGRQFKQNAIVYSRHDAVPLIISLV